MLFRSNYFEEFFDVTRVDDKQLRSVYYGFKTSMFTHEQKVSKPEEKKTWLSLDKTTSLFDKLLCDIPAQYANDAGTPTYRWADCKTKLRNIDTSKLHYISGMKENHIVIDFDIRGEDGNKSMEKNLEAAEKWPKTYAEFSKSGAGIHLHYIWGAGDAQDLRRIYSDGIEVKVFTGNSSLRRKLTW